MASMDGRVPVLGRPIQPGEFLMLLVLLLVQHLLLVQERWLAVRRETLELQELALELQLLCLQRLQLTQM